MKLLKNERAWKRWAKEFNSGQSQAPCAPPIEYPCFAYAVVCSFGYEEEQEMYLYPQDVARMSAAIEKATK